MNAVMGAVVSTAVSAIEAALKAEVPHLADEALNWIEVEIASIRARMGLTQNEAQAALVKQVLDSVALPPK